MREFWLVHPLDKVVTIYLLRDDAYGKPAVQELAGITASSVLPRVTIDWARVLRED